MFFKVLLVFWCRGFIAFFIAFSFVAFLSGGCHRRWVWLNA